MQNKTHVVRTCPTRCLERPAKNTRRTYVRSHARTCVRTYVRSQGRPFGLRRSRENTRMRTYVRTDVSEQRPREVLASLCMRACVCMLVYVSIPALPMPLPLPLPLSLVISPLSLSPPLSQYVRPYRPRLPSIIRQAHSRTQARPHTEVRYFAWRLIAPKLGPVLGCDNSPSELSHPSLARHWGAIIRQADYRTQALPDTGVRYPGLARHWGAITRQANYRTQAGPGTGVR